MTFDLHIGIDYSGRETPKSRTPALQVYATLALTRSAPYADQQRPQRGTQAGSAKRSPSDRDDWICCSVKNMLHEHLNHMLQQKALQ